MRFGTAFLAPAYLHVAGASAPIIALAAAGSTVGMGTGIASTYANNPNAGLHQYALGGGLGGAFGAANVVGSAVSLLGGGAGAAISAATGNDWRTGYQIGDLAGGLAGGGIDDGFRAYGKYAATGAKGAVRKAILHATAQTGVTAAFAGGGFAAGYYGSNGDMNSALFWANMASLPGNMIARKLVPCFAAGTPILTPAGSRSIETIMAGDLVLSRDEHHVEWPVEAKVVEEVFERLGVILHLHIGGQVIRTTQNVYNIRVADFHTYFVGSEFWGFGVWAHNTYAREEHKSRRPLELEATLGTWNSRLR